MTTPPNGEHEPDPEGPPADGGPTAWPADDRHATRPAPAWEPPPAAPGTGYGQAQRPGTPFYGPPGPAAGAPYGGQSYSPPGQAYGHSPFGPQPPYGAPPYGQHPGAPAHRSRAGLIAAVIGGVLLLGVAAVALMVALQTTVLDRAAVERDVAAQFQQREGVAVDLDCADEMKVDKGATYTCTGTTDKGEAVTLKIAITDEKNAAYTWGAP